MNSKKRIEIGVSSSLVDLKAELLRKQSELQDSKSQKKGVQKSVSRSDFLLDKKRALVKQKNTGVEKRNAADLEEHEKNEKTYDRAKIILEAKAKLYDKMTAEALDHEVYEHPVLANSLVNFQQKAIDNTLESNKAKPSYKPVEEQITEMKQRKWEEETEAASAKDDVHYQDVLFDELRPHGVGYYAFSTEEQKRADQIRDLKKMSEWTKSTRDKVMKERGQKKSQLNARLKKIVNRKRAKLGLPPKESSDEEEVTPEEEDPAKKAKLSDEKDNEDGRRSDDDEDERAKREKLSGLRAWDFAKVGVYGPKPVNFDELDYKWLKDRREDRVTDFAPPSTYYTKNRNYGQPAASTSFSSQPGNKYGNFVKAMETSMLQKQKREEIVKRQSEEGPPPPPVRIEQQQGPSGQYNDSEPSHTQSCPQPPIPIIPEIPGQDNYNINYKKKTQIPMKGAEIPPPPTFEYYHGGDLGGDRRTTINPRDQNMAQSIDAGLKALRERFEMKQQQQEPPPPGE